MDVIFRDDPKKLIYWILEKKGKIMLFKHNILIIKSRFIFIRLQNGTVKKVH
jgi:hypothetical protein